MEQELKNEIKALKRVHIGLISGVLLFIILSIYLNYIGGSFAFESDSNETKLFMIVSIVLAIGSISGGLIVFKKRIKNIASFNLIDKITKYREAAIIRVATIEGATFFFIVCFMLSGNYIFLVEAIGGFLFMLALFPTNYRIAKETKHDVRELNKF